LGTLDDIFDIQEKVSKSIANALRIKLSSDEKARISKQKINDATAYEQYLLARHEIWRSTKESLRHAIQLLNSSMDAIGRNEYLLTALAYVYFQYVNLGIYPDDKHLDIADELINEALTINPKLSKAYYIKSGIHETRGELIDSFNAIRQALKYDPADSEALMMMAFMYAVVGRPEKGMPYAIRAIEADPLYPAAYFGEWWVYQSAGKFDKALETCTKMYNLDKDNPISVNAYAYTFACNNNIKEATKLWDSLVLSHPDLPHSLLGKAIRHAINNEKQAALKTITEQVEKAAETDHIFAWWLAGVYSLIGEKEKAIDYLERVTRDIFIDYPFFAKHDPFLENIRKEERFKKLMVEVKEKWENFEV
jgi:Tfp pilus assembly protein PilF